MVGKLYARIKNFRLRFPKTFQNIQINLSAIRVQGCSKKQIKSVLIVSDREFFEMVNGNDQNYFKFRNKFIKYHIV